MKKLLLRLTTAVLILGLAGSILYVGFYFYTSWRGDRLTEQLSRQRSEAAQALASETSPTLPGAVEAEAPVAAADVTAGAASPTTGAAEAQVIPGNSEAVVPDAASAPTDAPRSGYAPAQTLAPAADAVLGGAAFPTTGAQAASNAAQTQVTPATTEAVVPDAASAPTDAPRSGYAPAQTLAPATGDVVVGTASLLPEASTAPAEDPLLSYYRELAAENPDMVGWIRIEDTAVDYPVMHTPEEPQAYLNRSLDGSYSVEGTPFLDGRCDANAPSDNLIVYGHNMRSGRMFGSLSRYREEEYRLAHPLVTFDTLEERRTYRIFAGFVVQLSDDVEDADMMCYHVDLSSDAAQLQALLDYTARNALFVDPEVELKLCDQLLTLSTCTSVRKSERFVLMAVRVA